MKRVTKYSLLTFALAGVLSFSACSSSTGTPTNTASQTDSGKIKTIDTKDLKDKVGKSDWVIIDSRVNDAFNGWKIDGVKRGGHIKGATDFSANWLKVEDKDKEKKLQEVLKTKGITPIKM